MSQHINPTPKQTDIASLNSKITNIPYGEYTGTELTSSINLHDLPNGRYLCISSSVASVSRNYPVAKGGYLDVVDRGNGMQKWLYYHTFSGEHYVQTYTAIDSAWTNWEELVLNSKLTAYNIRGLTINSSYVKGAGQAVKFGCFVMVKVGVIVTSQLGSAAFATVPANLRPSYAVNPVIAKYTDASGNENYYQNYINIETSGSITQGITGAMTVGSKIEATYLYKLN